jgi:hypothetical protein
VKGVRLAPVARVLQVDGGWMDKVRQNSSAALTKDEQRTHTCGADSGACAADGKSMEPCFAGLECSAYAREVAPEQGDAPPRKEQVRFPSSDADAMACARQMVTRRMRRTT